MKDGQWILNGTDSDIWGAYESFNTKEEAIEHAVNLLKKYNNLDQEGKNIFNLIDSFGIAPFNGKNIYTFFVGQTEEVRFPDEVDTFLENIAQCVYDEVGECSQGYLDDVTQEHKKELYDLMFEWAKRNDYLPNCFTIQSIEKIDISSLEEVVQ
ncbi:hypothetical protein [Listeria innocua]|uniref:hypothetical protein n=1 Tax=Listeria innocua TaxID=1642 RepID=UPI00162544FC|nr:hypothetical protein [Listeria innocua]MBC1377867.1 hypothetical protein [Listeria innocua]